MSLGNKLIQEMNFHAAYMRLDATEVNNKYTNTALGLGKSQQTECHQIKMIKTDDCTKPMYKTDDR